MGHMTCHKPGISALAFSTFVLFVTSACSRTMPSHAAAGTSTITRSPAVEAGSTDIDPGLEARSWISAADGTVLLNALGPYEGLSQTNIPDKERRLWSANGLRIFAVPSHRLAEIERGLRVGAMSASTQRQMLRPAAVWAEIARGSDHDGGLTVALDAGRLRLNAGVLRLMGRCWTMPLPPEGSGALSPVAGERIELLPEHLDSRSNERADRDDPLARVTTLSPIGDGLAFQRLELTLTARAGMAYVVVPEHPGVDWSDASTPRSTARSASEGDVRTAPKVGQVTRARPGPVSTPAADAGTSPGASAAAETAGPVSLGAPTIGQAMLMVDGGPAGDTAQASQPQRAKPTSRVILLLVPHVPTRFTLTGD